jgi:hypothetical protein
MRIQGFTWAAAVDERDIDALPKKGSARLCLRQNLLSETAAGAAEQGYAGHQILNFEPDKSFANGREGWRLKRSLLNR